MNNKPIKRNKISHKKFKKKKRLLKGKYTVKLNIQLKLLNNYL